jgi:hypothetical protein
MALRFRTELRNARLDQITAAISSTANPTPGRLRIYEGSAPALLTDAASGTALLAELVCQHPFAPPAAGGGLTVSAIADDTAADKTTSTGATFFRVVNMTTGNTIIQGTVTDTNGQGDLRLNNVMIQQGAVVSITSFTITEGNS